MANRKTIIAIMIGVSALSIQTAMAQDAWKPDTLRFIISHSVGGGQTPATHAMGKYWGPLLGSETIYENKPGASQRIGYDYFVGLSEAKECSAVLSSNPANAIVMYLQQKPDWKWEDSIVPIGLMAEMPGYWFVNANSDIKDLDGLIKEAKSRTLTVAMANYASSDNLQLHQVTEQVGAEFEVVPTGGAGKAMASVLGGHVDFGVNKLDSVLKGGSAVRVIAALVRKNPVPELTQNAPSVDEGLGVKTIRNSSTRAILAHKDCVTNYPERFALLQKTFEKVKKNKDYVAEAEKLGIPAVLIPTGGSDIIEETKAGYMEAFEKFGRLFD